MVQADICKYIILSDTDRKKGDLQYPHPNVVHRRVISERDSFRSNFRRRAPHRIILSSLLCSREVRTHATRPVAAGLCAPEAGGSAVAGSKSFQFSKGSKQS